MEYSQVDILNIKSKAISKVISDLHLAEKNDEIDEFLDKYNIVLEEEERLPIDTRTTKILVIGELAGHKKDYQMRAKKLDIDPSHIEFIDYEQSKKFSGERLRYSRTYSDILFGPTPHKTLENGEGSSLLATIKSNSMEYPRLIDLRANSTSGELKISGSRFTDALKKTHYYETLMDEQ